MWVGPAERGGVVASTDSSAADGAAYSTFAAAVVAACATAEYRIPRHRTTACETSERHNFRTSLELITSRALLLISEPVRSFTWSFMT